MSAANVPFIPFATPYLIPRQGYDAFLARIGYRVLWQKSHTCPCVFAGAGPQGRLPMPGQAQPECSQCGGLGIYWDAPLGPFRVGISFMHISPTPDEPGVMMDDRLGPVHRSEPSLTIPYVNPFLASGDPGQPTPAWLQAGSPDKFVAVDMLTRYNAVLQVSGAVSLPYPAAQNYVLGQPVDNDAGAPVDGDADQPIFNDGSPYNLSVALSGAVTVYDPVTTQVSQVSGYVVSGSTVRLPSGYPPGTNYIVEFYSASAYIAFRKAGGDPHIRPMAGGQIAEPRRFRLQELDLWLRQNVPNVQVFAPVTNSY